MNTSPLTWHPVAPSAGLRPGANIVAGFAEGHELALWRTNHGAPQAWDNRCPHRSVRFTLGQIVDGERLACAYHGWQYAAGDGHCTRIPAHPAMEAPRSLCAKTHEAIDAAGMVWVRLSHVDSPPPVLNDAVPAGWHFARTLTLRVPAERVRDGFARRGFAPGASGAWRGRLDGVQAAALVLDAQPQLAFVHLWTDAEPDDAAMQTLLRAVREMRADIEAAHLD